MRASRLSSDAAPPADGVATEAGSPECDASSRGSEASDDGTASESSGSDADGSEGAPPAGEAPRRRRRRGKQDAAGLPAATRPRSAGGHYQLHLYSVLVPQINITNDNMKNGRKKKKIIIMTQ